MNIIPFVILGVLCILFLKMFFLLVNYKRKIIALESNIQRDFKENLELATTDQLLKEIRKRNNCPFVLLSPIKEKDYNGISVEVHSMNSVAALATIHLAKEIFVHNMKRKGDSGPELPSLEDYFRED